MCSLGTEIIMVTAPTSESISPGSLPNDAQETTIQNKTGKRRKSMLKQSWMEITVAFMRRTKVHGLMFVFSPDKTLTQRILWLLAFFVCVGLLFTWSWNRILYLMSYPAVTRIKMEWTHNMSFPAVTFCNHNLFRVSSLTKVDLYHCGYWMDLMHQNHSVMEKSLALLRDNHKYNLLSLLDFNGYTPPPRYHVNTTEMIGRLGHQLEDMLLECRFRGENCTHQNFTTIYTRYGKCYTFNSGLDGNPLLTTLKGGTGNGLEIMLDIQQDEYLPVWGETDETSYEAGVKVQIHTQSEPPFPHQLGFGVAPGFQTFVSSQEQRLQYLPPPWGDCKSTPIDSEFFSTYSITACRIDCETRYLVENCNCRMVHMPGTSMVCTPEQYKDCADPALDFLVEKDNDYCVCETPCNMIRYGKELSMVKIPSKASAKYLAKKFNKTEQYIGENVLVLDIFFEALNYEKIEQKKAYEIAGLLGDIGGQMGLFIGASVLTILEIFDYLYEVFKDKVLGYFMRKKRPQRCPSDNLEFPENPTSPGVTPNHAPRAPVTPSGVTRTVSDSHRTCYLVTRL
ncbi:acid-sensing ion channel 1C-like isoform X1 [Salvelinus fontinalis]|uniref:acid-sensing ion channel 1C-like isoform X1 n=1 Tax=Salvelinus fontinalis TaxID=8038 RepID=UPI0024852606|nr:acid-sensing ion channel 1C-like isoform X1 [Salvelinus fontinalis]